MYITSGQRIWRKEASHGRNIAGNCPFPWLSVPQLVRANSSLNGTRLAQLMDMCNRQIDRHIHRPWNIGNNRPQLCTLCIRYGLITSCYSGMAARGRVASAPLWITLRISTAGKFGQVTIMTFPLPSPSTYPSHSESGLHVIQCPLFWAPEVHTPNGISIGSSVSAQVTVVVQHASRQTHRPYTISATRLT